MLGYAPPNGSEVGYQKAIDAIVSSAKRHSKKVGLVVKTGEEAQHAKRRFDLVVLSADARALQGWYGRELEVARG